MSRSYKKTSIIKYCGNSRFGKRQANKKVRVYNDVSLKGNSYKKLYESYNINDIVEYCSKEKAIRDDFLDEWNKAYYRK